MIPAHPHPEPDTRLTSAHGFELLLTLLVCTVLYQLAAPLPGVAQAVAEMGRYRHLAGLAHVPANPLGLWFWLTANWQNADTVVMARDARAVWLLYAAGPLLAVTGLLGWLALQFARTSTAWAGGLVLALWSALAWLLRPFELPGILWLGLAALGGCMTVLTLPVWPWQQHRVSASRDDGGLNRWTACVWPGWLLFVGTGCLLAIDFAAHGPIVPGGMDLQPVRPGARYFGLSQMDGMWLASAVLLAAVLGRATWLRSWIGVCNTLVALMQRPRGPVVLGLAALGLTLLAGWLGYFSGRNYLGIPGLHGAGKPHISGEIVRLLACVVLAWYAYRVGEWRGSAQRTWLRLRGLLLVGLLCALALWVSDDKGPLLILALALPLLLGLPLLRQLQNKPLTGLLAALLVASLIWLWRTLLVDWLPQVSRMAAAREYLRAHLFEASSPNLAQARWLMEAAPPDGFGLAHVPYCGARAWLEPGLCSLGSGAPLQMPSDMAYALVTATFGAGGAVLVMILLLLWLAALPVGLLSATPHGTHPLRLWPAWLVAVACLAAQAQVLVSAGAVLGWSSLTGVTLPLFGFGSAALCASAIWVGLAADSRDS